MQNDNENKQPQGERYQSFAEFYPFYLEQHSNRTCRRLHVVGTSLSLLAAITLVVQGLWLWLPTVLIIGYAFAWVGHFFFEHNRPATFTYPLYSFAGDFVMLKDVLTGRLRF
ncbi:hypothetical protein SAMN05660443_1534 [Marinospirillum celere]|uniref:DUF962 domain-containing protein n=1 Tax=Marinospirillum celere TaxID=1122252 RepID=A0A1I1GN76_9GAMM|nr:DUF962 domain-containing protein [Marinospirillum celere]SFC12971.1 hypothetical protein SAMN05660443_1534 [Marinospirillum celere]